MIANRTLIRDITLYVIGLLSLTLPAEVSADAGTSSLLSQGRWIKVHVDTTSVHRIPYTLLKEWGFDNPDNIIIAGYGSVERVHSLHSAPDDLPVLPVSREKEGIYFFAEGDTRVALKPGTSLTPFNTYYNYYSSGSCYFIGERTGITSPDITAMPDDASDGPTINSHTAISHTAFHEDHLSKHGLLTLSHNITADTPRAIDYDVTNHEGSATLYYTYGWLHSNQYNLNIGTTFSAEVIRAQNSAEQLAKNASSHIVFSVQENGHSALELDERAERFTATYSNPSGSFSTLALINTTLLYSRSNRLGTQPMVMHFNSSASGGRILLENTRSDTRIWDVTDRRTPVLLQATPVDGKRATVTVPRGHSMPELFAYGSADSLPVPTFTGQVTNQSLHSLTDVDMLIVTLPDTRDAAMRLAAAHEQWQDMKVAVVDQSDIFNEFSSGSLHPDGLRSFVTRLSQSSTRPLRYLLLFGNGTWDTRGSFDKSGREYMVTYGTEDYTEMGHTCRQYSSDLYFGTTSASIPAAFSSLRPRPIVSVGRIPVSDASSAEAYVDKCIAYLSDPSLAGAFNHAIVSGGPGDESQHITGAETHASIISSLTESPTVNRAHLSLFALDKPGVISSNLYTKYLNMLLAGDSRIFNYTGHGSIDRIAYNSFTITEEKSVNYRTMPLAVMTACSTSPIDLQETSLGKSILLHTPGPIAVVGTGNEVYLKYNVKFHEQFLRLFYSPDAGECLGDVFRQAISDSNSSSSQTINNLCYNFLGDPAMPRYLPSRTATLTRVGDTDVSNADTRVSVPPLTRLHLAGTVNTPNGEVDTSFNGKMTLCIYDAPHTARTLVHLSGDKVSDLTLDESLIYTSSIRVTGGTWETDVTLPSTLHPGTNRMTLNAVSEADRVIACGGNTILSVSDSSSPSTPAHDTTPPVINIRLDSSSDGGVTSLSPSPTLHIEITDDDSGVNLNLSTPGMAPRISLDGTTMPQIAYLMHPSDEGTTIADYTFGELADGLHTITVTARDLCGNSAVESVTFTVIHRDTTASLSVSSSIVRDDVTFALTHSLPVAPSGTRLVIRDMEGRTVLSTDTATYPYTWDFTTADGSTAPDGTYRASVIIDAHPYYTSTPETQFTIIKRSQP